MCTRQILLQAEGVLLNDVISCKWGKATTLPPQCHNSMQAPSHTSVSVVSGVWADQLSGRGPLRVFLSRRR